MKRFTETQAFSAFAYIVIGLTTIPLLLTIALTQSRTFLSLGWPLVVVPFGLICNLLCQKTEVSDSELTITFGAFVPLYRRHFALPKITAAEAVTYAPIADYGGWGIRGWGRNIALNARGNRGVRLVLDDGGRVLVGSQRPQELAQALSAK